MKIAYQEPKKFQKKTLEIIHEADRIVTEYEAQGYRITVRQLWYQFIARQPLSEYFDNTPKNNKKFREHIKHARLCGLIDWHQITDAGRPLYGPEHWDNPQDWIKESSEKYALDKWSDQPLRIEVWIEKGALRGIIAPVCDELDLDHFSASGFTSTSTVWGAAERILRYQDTGQQCVILHLADHDPSGLDMTRDIEHRLLTFHATPEVKRIALTRDQVDALQPAPNAVKMTDSRAPDYIRQHGYESWELDALSPAYISDLIRDEVARLRDDDLYSQRESLEERHRQQLATVVSEFTQ